MSKVPMKETPEEAFERGYHGHGRGVVVTQPEAGKFVERPMTPAELAARAPAAEIQRRLYELATYAGFAYIKAWEIIAHAIETAIQHDVVAVPSPEAVAALVRAAREARSGLRGSDNRFDQQRVKDLDAALAPFKDHAP